MNDFYQKLLREKRLEQKLGWTIWPIGAIQFATKRRECPEPERYLRENT